MFNKSLWSSLSGEWMTPIELYKELDKEFHFTLDPCPINATTTNGLDITWTGNVYVNPPYGRHITDWIAKGYFSSLLTANVVVMLLPSRTGTIWWHEYVMEGEIRFIKGRLKFGNATNSAPFDSVIVIFSKDIIHHNK